MLLEMNTTDEVVWGTWEELVLAGAVDRYGTGDWNTVAAELRSRTQLPSAFTPQVCKAKYENLQQRYSGCKAWFEELRKHRIAELRHALDQSEDLIGSLRSKIRNLKAEKSNKSYVDHQSTQPVSLVPYETSEGCTSSNRETSNDGLSAGSFTQETRMNCSPECQASAPLLDKVRVTTREATDSPERENSSGAKTLTEIVNLSWEPIARKKRGKRKRKEFYISFKEIGTRDTGLFASADTAVNYRRKETSTNNCGQLPRSSGFSDYSKSSENRDGVDVLMGIFDSVLKNKSSSVFHHRLDGQKRRRYKEIIRQHVDFDTIKLRITKGSITSTEELFRDLLLLTNNALIFYSKRTREYKSALILRDIVTKMLRQHRGSSCTKEPSTKFHSHVKPSIGNHHVKLQSACSRSLKASKNLPHSSNVTSKASPEARESDKANSPPLIKLLAVQKKGFGQSKKVGRQGPSQHRVNTTKNSRKRL